VERPITGALDHRVDPEHQLVDKAVLDQETREGPASRADQIAMVFVLEPLNSFGHVALDEGGVPLERGRERCGGYPLGHRVQHVGPGPSPAAEGQYAANPS
jgi:hypothetical protein